MSGRPQKVCYRGHPLEGGNIAMSGGRRQCRTCRHRNSPTSHWWDGDICKICFKARPGTKMYAIGAFLKKVDLPNKNGCVLWTGGVSRRGYGQFGMQIEGRQVVMNAMRAAWLLFVGPIPPNRDVCHHCDVKLCVRTEHLFIGTRSENHQDAVKKGRWPTSKMTPDQVRELRRRREAGEKVKDIAQSVGMPLARVQAALTRRTFVAV